MAKKIFVAMKDNPGKKISEVLKVVNAFAHLDFSKKAKINGKGDENDALAAGINMLGEVLRESTVSLKEKDALVKEVHHRVKNNLQIISSLLSLQENFVKVESARKKFRESRERVRSMALIHEMLYMSKKFSEIDFSEYLKTLVHSLFSTYNITGKKIALQLDITIDEKYLDIDTAIPCGLIVNEIISNSFKHAFFKRKNGSITVQMKNVMPQKFLLSIADDGSGFPKKMNINSASFGVQLINTLVEQINGNIDFKTGKPGTRYDIGFSV